MKPPGVLPLVHRSVRRLSAEEEPSFIVVLRLSPPGVAAWPLHTTLIPRGLCWPGLRMALCLPSSIQVCPGWPALCCGMPRIETWPAALLWGVLGCFWHALL